MLIQNSLEPAYQFDVDMKVSQKKHFGIGNIQEEEVLEKDFSKVFLNALDSVNQKQVEAQELSIKMVSDPESVEAHELSIAQTKAEFALRLTQSILGRVTNAVKDLENIR